MLVKEIKDNVDCLVDMILAKDAREIESLLTKLDDDKRATIWRNFIRRTRPYEVKFTKVLKGLFRQQEAEVLANMRKHPKAYYTPHVYDSDITPGLVGIYTTPNQKQNWLSQWLFAEMMWRKRFSNNGKIFIGGVLEDVGQAELTNLIVGIDFDISNPLVQDFISKNADKFSFATNKATIDSLRKQLIAGVKLGESIPELTKRVNKVFGFAEKYRATRIARSEIIRSANAGAEFAYIQSGVCKGKEWVTAWDERTCPECEAMDGRKAPLGGSFDTAGLDVDLDYTEGAMPYSPLHVSCRCTIVSILI